MIRVATWIIAVALAAFACFGLTACSGDEDAGSGTTAATETTGDTGSSTPDQTAEEGEDSDDADETDADMEVGDEAAGDQIEELLAMHPIFPTKRFMNFAARGNPEACSMLSDKGRQAMERAHGMPCPKVIRSAAADRKEPGLMIGGEFVPVDGFSDLEYPTTILVLNREIGRVTIEGERRPFRLSRYGRIWLIDQIPLAEVGTVS